MKETRASMPAGTILCYDPLNGGSTIQPADGTPNLLTRITNPPHPLTPGTPIRYTVERTGHSTTVIID